MKSQLLISFALVSIASAIGATAAFGEEHNPRHPSYFVNKSRMKVSHVDSRTIALPTNPLQPNYYSQRVGGSQFMGTVARHRRYSIVNVHSGNPRHPGFRRD